MDDDIVFLGSSPATHTLPNNRPAQRPVTGVSLHVDRNGSIDAHTLSFQRMDGIVVHIGRRPAMDPVIDDTSSTTAASFRCAVVSRRHAKIAFSDSGHAYLIDLGSHHGTHVRGQGDRLARALKPETPTLLVDGDVVTFGKSVGKGDECVRPIVVRVELLHDLNTSTTFQTLSLPPSPPSSPKTHSGRYGIRTISSSSSDESAENDGYSDIEEIPPPVQQAPGANQSSQSQTEPPNQASQTSCGPYPSFKFGQLNALRRFLPPMNVVPQAPWHIYNHHHHSHPPMFPDFQRYEPSPPPPPPAAVLPLPTVAPSASRKLPIVRLPPPVPAFVERPLAQLSHLSQFFLNVRGAGETSNTADMSSAPAANADLPVNVENASEPNAGLSACIDANTDAPAPPVEVSPSPESSSYEWKGPYEHYTDSVQVHITESSFPPIDYDSPAHSLRGSPLSDLDSDSDSDFSSSSSRNSERERRERERSIEREMDGASSEPMDLSSRCSTPAPVIRSMDKGKSKAILMFDTDADEGGEKDMDIENDSPTDLDVLRKRINRSAERSSQSALRRIEDAVAILEADLMIHRGQTKATLAKHTNQMEVFDGRIREVDAECGVLCVRVETLGERVGAVELDVASNAEASFNALEAEAEKELANEEARKESVDAVRVLIAEAQGELRALKALRAEAEAFTARQKEQEQHQVRRAVHASAVGSDADDGAPQPPVVPPSLKRKRDDSDEDATADADEAAHGSDNAPVPPKKAADATENEKDSDVVMDAHSLPLATSTSGIDSCASAAASSPMVNLPGIERSDALPPPRKRARRIVGLMARTATAVGVGAVVTWTALAFS